MPDSPLKPQAAATRDAARHLADTPMRARAALVDPQFTPAALPDGVLLELIALAYQEHRADRLRATADELLRRLGHGAPVTAMRDLTARLEAVEARLAALEGTALAPAPLPNPTDTAPDSSGNISPSVTPPDEGAPAGRLTRDVIHDVLMTALELGLSVEQPATRSAPLSAGDATDDPGEHAPDVTPRAEIRGGDQ